MEKITLSPSKLNVFRECPRCFWDAEKESIKRPRGPFPSLPGGIDIVLKKFFDGYRGRIPEILKKYFTDQKVKFFEDQALLKRWRFWRSAPRYFDAELNVEVYGAFDDLIMMFNPQTQQLMIIPFDYKTKGSEPKDDGSQYYQLQMDIYNLLLQSNGHPVAEKAFLMYVWPSDVQELTTGELGFRFQHNIFELPCSVERAKKTIAEGVACLRGPRPEADPQCEYCLNTDARIRLMKQGLPKPDPTPIPSGGVPTIGG